ncbi:hypothetical protein LX16_5260 [Stackebrandtia albiflava]|uniref:Integral membrane protein n=1 Tax=Stackebrandtia albiflava TaxID=406432 RepID=A0A562ULM5_9ACTN|nr:hypothetical protein [Stackebrandtia albiflava]TWJ06523.1 hypothetical protein LX16_5260 [Stackebrandtia albiflava]
MPEIVLSDASRTIAGVVLLTVVTIEFGGWFLTRIVSGAVPMTDFQKTFARAGHAHAGVLVTLGLVCLVLADATGLTGLAGTVARLGVPAAAVLMSAGFFLSSLGRDVHRPNRLIVLLWLGAASLAAGVVTLGIGLLAA